MRENARGLRGVFLRTGWPARPIWLLLLTTALLGAIGLIILLTLAAAFVSGGYALFPTAVLILGMIIAIPVGVVLWAGGALGWLAGRVRHRDALGALVGALAFTTIPALVLLVLVDPFTGVIAAFAAGGGAGGAVVFFFEVRWHRAATENPVAA